MNYCSEGRGERFSLQLLQKWRCSGEMRGFRVTHAYTSIPGAQVPSSVSVSIAISFLAKKFASDSVLLILSPFPQRIILIGVEAFLPPSIKLRQSVPKSCHLTHLAVVHSLNCVRLFATLWTTAYQAPLSSTISQSLLRFMSIELVILYNDLSISIWYSMFPLRLMMLNIFSYVYWKSLFS